MKPIKKTDQQTRKPVLRPDGSTIDQWVIGLAIPEQEFIQKVWPAMDAEAKTGFPQGIPPQFSYKLKNGAGIDRTGKPYASREGYAGHYVLTIATEAFAPSVYKWENGVYRQLAANEIKAGDYIIATVSFQVNVPANKMHTPGLFINPRGFLLVGYGKEIVGAAADPTQIFGQQPQQFQLPPGASYTPIAPTNVAPPYGAPPAGTGAYPPNPAGPPGYPPQGPQPGNYAPPPNGPPITTGPQYGQQPPAPGQYPPMGAPPPGMPPAPGNPAYAPQYGQQPPAPGQYPPPGAPPNYAPAHDFVQNAGQQQPGYPPQQQPGYPPQQQPGQPYPPR